MPHICFFVDVDTELYSEPCPAGSKESRGQSRTTGKTILVDACRNTGKWQARIKRTAFAEMNRRGLSVEDFDFPLETHMIFGMHLNPTAAKSFKYGDYHIYKPDITKLTRAIEDAMTDTVYPDDNRICREGVKVKLYLPNPGVFVCVRTLPRESKIASAKTTPKQNDKPHRRRMPRGL